MLGRVLEVVHKHALQPRFKSIIGGRIKDRT